MLKIISQQRLAKIIFQQRFATIPVGASPTQSARLGNIKALFTGSYSSTADVEVLQEALGKIALAFETVKDEISDRLFLENRIAAAATVPGAPPSDLATLQTLHTLAEKAAKEADSREKLTLAQDTFNKLDEEHTRITGLVTARQMQAERIQQDAAALVDPPEAGPDGLKAERDQLATALKTAPITDAALLTAEQALITLKAAHTAADTEAKALRQIRSVYGAEVAELRRRVAAMTADMLPKDRDLSDNALAAISASESLLEVTKSRAETEGFPQALADVKKKIWFLLNSTLSKPNDTGTAAGAYLRSELNALRDEINKLPKLDDKAKAFAQTASKQAAGANSKMTVGSVGKRAAALPDVQNLAQTIAEWRAHIGPVKILLDQRKTTVEDTIKKDDPPGVAPSFQAALKAIRDQVTISLKKVLKDFNEVNVIDAETKVAPFAALLAEAEADVAAVARVATAKATLDAELNTVINKARPPVQIELRKARDRAEKRAALTDINRDMPGTATLYETLIARMQAVKSEATTAPSLGAIDASVRPLAFDLCGPDLLASLTDTQTRDLGQVLVSDGAAIKALMEDALGGNPKLFAKLLNDCGAEGLAALARALDDAARKALDGLIANGGLGADPALLSQLLGPPPLATDTDPAVRQQKADRQKANAAAIKSLAQNFKEPAGQTALATLLDDCALNAHVGILASLFQENGFAGDGAKLRAFANAFVGDSALGDRANLARLIRKGGFADHPRVFGPLAKLADAGGVKAIGTAFTKDTDLTHLKALLDHGGMSGDTHQPGKTHEHSDTLAKVFVEGLEANGDKLKRFAKAFGSTVAAQSKAKEMLDAFNEYADADAEFRRPGLKIRDLLDNKHLKGNIEALESKFMTQMRLIAAGTQRNQAIRFAPHFKKEVASEGWKPKSAAMTAAGIDSVTASVLKRHKPEAFELGKVGPVQSMFPPDTDVGALVDEAMGLIDPDRIASQRVDVGAGSPRPGDPPITVEIGFIGGNVVNHFGPRGTVGPPHPKETPTFSQAEITSIFASIQ